MLGSLHHVESAVLAALPKPGCHVVIRTFEGKQRHLVAAATEGVLERIHRHGVLVRTRRGRIFVSFVDLWCGDVEIASPTDVRRRIAEERLEIIRKLPNGERRRQAADALSLAG